MSTVSWRDVSDIWYAGLHEADLNGIVGEVGPSVSKPDEFFWSVKPTGRRCEWPELIDAGVEADIEDAKQAAEAVMVQADADYPTMPEGGW